MLLPPTLAKLLTKFSIETQNFKRLWTYIASKKRIEQSNVFSWLSKVKNLVLSNAFEYVQKVIQWHQHS